MCACSVTPVELGRDRPLGFRILLLMVLVAATDHGTRAQAPIEESFEVTREGFVDVALVDDGAEGRAVRFARPTSRVELGPAGVDSGTAFNLRVRLRTRSPDFATAVMARDGEAVGFSLVSGRRPGIVGFEAWSWTTTRLESKRRIDDGVWHEIAVDYDARTNVAVLRLDGRLEAFGELGFGGAPKAQLRLGNNLGAAQPFSGDLDEFSLRFDQPAAGAHAGLAPIQSAEERLAALVGLREAVLRRHAPPARLPDAAILTADARRLRPQVLDALGLVPEPPRDALAVQVHATWETEELVLERISFAGLPGQRATGWLWRPRSPSPRPGPAVLSPHGHWAGGATHAVVQTRARNFARLGWVVLVPDSVHVEHVPAGLSSIGVMTWNNLRALEVLLARPEVDPRRIAVTGASGGAQQTMYLMAVEDRLAAAAPICMISEFQEILDERSAHCGCNHPPRVGFLADEPELCAAFAPRPAFYGSVSGDWTRHFPEQGLPFLRRVYDAFDQDRRRHTGASGNRSREFPESLRSLHLDAGHNYDRPFREAVLRFFFEHLERDAGARTPEREALLTESRFTPFPSETLLALPPRSPAPDRKLLADELVRRRGTGRRLESLAPALPWTVGKGTLARITPAPGSGGFVTAVVRPGRESGLLPVPLLLRERRTEGPWTVVVAHEGKGMMLAHPPEWLAALDRVAVIDVRGVGEGEAFAAAWRRNGLLLGLGEGYGQAHDVALVAATLGENQPVTVLAPAWTGVVALIAATISGRIERVVAADLGPGFAEDPDRAPFCPEILRFGEVERLVPAIVGPRRVVIGGMKGRAALANPGVDLVLRDAPLDESALAQLLSVR